MKITGGEDSHLRGWRHLTVIMTDSFFATATETLSRAVGNVGLGFVVDLVRGSNDLRGESLLLMLLLRSVFANL